MWYISYNCVCCQIIEGEVYNSSVDWFSFGVVLYEMIVGRLPFDGFDEEEMFQRITVEEPKYPKVIHADAVLCIKLVWFWLELCIDPFIPLAVLVGNWK